MSYMYVHDETNNQINMNYHYIIP